MIPRFAPLLALAALVATVGSSPLAAEDGFVSIFDGKTLDGWDGDPKFWSVQDGAITGQTTKDNPTKGNTFIIWDGELADFELMLDYKIVGGNSGVQYRSFKLKNGADGWRIGGYQADIDSTPRYTGIIYGERARGILVERGQSGTIAKGGKKSAERFEESAAIQKKIKNEDWNTYRIVAKGNHLVQYINGVKTAELVDNDAAGEGKRMASGLLALQLHQGPPMTVQFRNIKLKKIAAKETAGLRIRVDEQGRVAVAGTVTTDLGAALEKVADDVLEAGVVFEVHPKCPAGRVQSLIRECQEAGAASFRLTVAKEGLSLETSEGRIDLGSDGTVDARLGRLGLGYRNGRGRVSLFGITAYEFGAATEAAVPEIPEVDLGAPEVDLGEGGAFEEGASLETAPTTFVAAKADPKKIVFIAGKRSHGYGSHEHKAGCMLLADQLEKSGLNVETHVVTEGWPKDETVLNDADTIVVYADGGGRHPFNPHIATLDALAKKGVGIVCIHYGVEVPKGKSGDAFLDWTGGFFETDWSVNPHWTADFKKMPKHPTTRGVKPFKVNDEWYYHMRFRDQGVTPILSDLPPKESLKRKDGPHSGNPFVRKAVLEDMRPQHVAWAREREGGGRGFGITGGHFHWNWGNDQMRKLMLNAIVWSAGADVPAQGVPTQPVTVEDLMANQDYDVPGNFNPMRIEEMLKQWNR